jgi:large subunit ribosomal protein L37Ae
MSRRTRKAGVSGRFGPRYGVRTRKQISAVEGAKNKAYECPRCKHVSVRRVSTGIWQCRRCDLKFAGGAYSPQVTSKVPVRKPSDAEVEVIGEAAGEPVEGAKEEA